MTPDPSRREFLALVGTGLSARSKPPQEASDRDLLLQSASDMARAVARKEVSSLDLVNACLTRIDEANPDLNAVVQIARDEALADARRADARLARGASRGALHGVPMTIKDSFDTAGLISTAGTLGRANFVPETDATVVRRLKQAGAILLGKSNTPELTFAGDTDNLVYGRTNNPHDLERSPGGSSGGAAAIVAALGSPFDVGSDTGGSIRAPAHFTGIAGIKPTSGRVPRTGHVIGFEDATESLTSIGPLARTVEDLERILAVIAGPDGRDPAVAPASLLDSRRVDVTSLRVAFYHDNGEAPADDETRAAVELAARSLADHGCPTAETRPAPLPRATDLLYGLLLADGGAGVLRRLERAGTREPHPWTRGFLDAGTEVSGSEAFARIEAWASFRREMLVFFDRNDVILCPVVTQPAPLHLAPGDARDFRTWYTTPYNLTGWPAAVVRCGTSSEGLPIGIQVVAPPWREDVALAVAAHLESALGGYAVPARYGSRV